MSRRTQDPTRPPFPFGYGACTRYGRAFNRVRLVQRCAMSWSYNPRPWPGLGFSPFARRYSGNHCFVFLSSGYLDVSVRRVPLSCPMCSGMDDSLHCCRVPPFGHRRIVASLQLPGAFRGLARPSSVLSGKASSVRPSLLNQWFSFLHFHACFEMCSFFLLILTSRTVFYCFLSVSYNFRYRPFCYVFSLRILFSFQRPILEGRSLKT